MNKHIELLALITAISLSAPSVFAQSHDHGSQPPEDKNTGTMMQMMHHDMIQEMSACVEKHMSQAHQDAGHEDENQMRANMMQYMRACMAEMQGRKNDHRHEGEKPN